MTLLSHPNAPKVVFYLLVMTGTALISAGLMADYKNAQIEKLKADYATEKAMTAEAALKRLQAAQARGDDLEERLAKSEQTRQIEAQERQREIKHRTAGLPCLNASTVSLLNQSADGLHSASVPDPAGRSIAADAPAASDTDVALWIDGAKRQYEQCRDRLQALIDWEKGEKQ